MLINNKVNKNIGIRSTWNISMEDCKQSYMMGTQLFV